MVSKNGGWVASDKSPHTTPKGHIIPRLYSQNKEYHVHETRVRSNETRTMYKTISLAIIAL